MNKEQVKHYCIQQVKQGDWIDMSGHSCRDCKFYDTISSPGCGRSTGMMFSGINCKIAENSIENHIKNKSIFPFDVIWTGSEYLKWLVEYGK